MTNEVDIFKAADTLILKEIRKSRWIYLSILLSLIVLDVILVLNPSFFESEMISWISIAANIILPILFFISFLKAATFALDIPSWLIFVIIIVPRFIPIPGLTLLIILALAILVEVKIMAISKSLKKPSSTSTK